MAPRAFSPQLKLPFLRFCSLRNYLGYCLLEAARLDTLQDLLLCSPATSDLLMTMVNGTGYNSAFYQGVWKLTHEFCMKTIRKAERFEAVEKDAWEQAKREEDRKRRQSAISKESSKKGNAAIKCPYKICLFGKECW
jgi:hypothetical protein